MKIATVVGARPQFIKAAVVSRALREYRTDVREVIVHTGQHFDVSMSDVFFEELDIPRPNYQLGIGGGTHGQNTGRMVEAIEGVLLAEDPEWVMVYGDTDSTLAGTLAAVKLHLAVAHVEAGLRSFNRRMPEEINRVLTDHAASMLFTPTDTATRNLANEGIAGECVKQVGDVMYDATLHYRIRARAPQGLGDEEGFVLATIHRAENVDDPRRLASILGGLSVVANSTKVVLPLHPRTAKQVKRHGLETGRISILDPVTYLEMVWMLERASVVVTDSGGLQKEAYFFRKPCITIREETEWMELVLGGWNRLVGPCQAGIAKAVLEACDMPLPKGGVDMFGDGHSGSSLVRSL